MEDKHFLNFFKKFIISCDDSIFDKFKKTDRLNFYLLLFNKLDNSIKDNLHNDILNLITLLYQDFPDDNHDLETVVSDKAVDSFNEFVNSLKKNRNDSIEIKIIYCFIDLFFHNPHFVDFLNEKRTNLFLKNLIKILDIEKEIINKSVDFILVIQYTLIILTYFDDKFVYEYKKMFLEHPDLELRNIAKEELG